MFSKQQQEDAFYLRALVAREQQKRIKNGYPGYHKHRKRISIRDLKDATPDEINELLKEMRS